MDSSIKAVDACLFLEIPCEPRLRIYEMLLACNGGITTIPGPGIDPCYLLERRPHSSRRVGLSGSLVRRSRQCGKRIGRTIFDLLLNERSMDLLSTSLYRSFPLIVSSRDPRHQTLIAKSRDDPLVAALTLLCVTLAECGQLVVRRQGMPISKHDSYE